MGFEGGGGECRKIWLQRRGQGKNIGGEGGGWPPPPKDICDNRELNNASKTTPKK